MATPEPETASPSAGQPSEIELALGKRESLDRARLQLVETVTDLRHRSVITAIVLLIVALFVEFLAPFYMAESQRLLLNLMPLALLAGAGVLDLLHYQPQLEAREAEITTIEEEVQALGGPSMGGPTRHRRERTRVVVTLYYLIPMLTGTVLVLWRFS